MKRVDCIIMNNDDKSRTYKRYGWIICDYKSYGILLCASASALVKMCDSLSVLSPREAKSAGFSADGI